MRLKSVKILGKNFRSLSANKLYEFKHSFREDRLSTKIFAGLNGSGKSNFLELFSEIFYFLEVCHLETIPQSEKENKEFGFELEYYLPKTEEDIKKIFAKDFREVAEKYIKNNLPLTKYTREEFEKNYYREIGALETAEVEKVSNQLLKDGYAHVRITKPQGAAAEYNFVRQDEIKEPRKVTDNTQEVLPTKVIAYTSGQNELLSNPYYKLKYHYFKTFEDKKKLDVELAENHRLFFLDYSTNFSIFIANILLADKKKADILKDALQLHDLQSFRITLNTKELYKKVIPVNEKLAYNLEKLKLCSTCWIEKSVGEKNLLILDYLINDETKAAFEYHFSNAFTLFKLFYELEIFNLYLVDKPTRDLMLQVHKSYNFSDEMPKPEPSRLVFRIEKVFISKKIDEGNPKNIYYKALSDGEHQFNEVVGTILMMEQEGCLFLIDEPDTHFNPKWRAKLIKMLNYMAAISFNADGNIEKVRKQEIVITTHSPFVISDSNSEDVYRFTKEKGMIEFTNPEIQMYGADISIILDEIFEKEETISDMAKKELKDMVENITTMDELRKVVDRLNNEFGDSATKFDLFSKLKKIKSGLETKK